MIYLVLVLTVIIPTLAGWINSKYLPDPDTPEGKIYYGN